MKLALTSHHIWKNPEMHQWWNVRTQTIKHLENRKQGVKFYHLDLAVDFEIWHQKHNQQKKEMTNFITSKLKFCASNNIIEKLKEQLTKYKKYFQIIY
jgi:hypothetical protein